MVLRILHLQKVANKGCAIGGDSIPDVRVHVKAVVLLPSMMEGSVFQQQLNTWRSV